MDGVTTQSRALVVGVARHFIQVFDEYFNKVRVDRTRGVQQPSKLKIAEFDSPYPLQNLMPG